MSASRSIVCGLCGQTNRVRDHDPKMRPLCGSCGCPIFDGRPFDVDEVDFDHQVSVSGVPILVDVWASWSGPCRAMAPMFEMAARKLEPDVRMLKLNGDAAPGVMARYGIRTLPSLLLIARRKLIAQSAGLMESERIVTWVRGNLAKLASAGTRRT